MVDDGYEDVVNIDISSMVIEAMQKKYSDRPQLKSMKMDTRDMSSFEGGSFDAVVDKEGNSRQQKWELMSPIPLDSDGKSVEAMLGENPDVHYIYVCIKNLADLANITMRHDQMEASRDKAMEELTEIFMSSLKRGDNDKQAAWEDYSPTIGHFGLIGGTPRPSRLAGFTKEVTPTRNTTGPPINGAQNRNPAHPVQTHVV
ncbi:hypothetical protein K7X08_010491 [Anisodus acutangulus]|uniref:Methyltransferase type 11 domain-containing protein n=1 Tax=Anisodus acutangulus TaxID=402998 RepID=A0A9Q1RRS6_9SOLA|nr:hypothetical protein K7X08_010491 [Anisodus acutangulus]